MNIIKFDPYKKVTDGELIDEIRTTMEKLRYLQNNLKDGELSNNQNYISLFIQVNSLIKEAKRRNVKIDKERLARRLFIE
ncbi:hypothetical protein [Sporosalibacterium faouarense]|uniref:hypothetical protein n=1 Tax=Sporosalibacterium faouarense TaxID=516123 RepID=UPI00192BE0AA|nr:hypothetical protein [Sporosalibacterium faouarense]